MDRYERILSLHRTLKAARYPVTVARLQDELGCSRATVYRDLAFLRDALMAPIVGDGEAGFRYDQDEADRFELPGLWLNSDELHALLERALELKAAPEASRALEGRHVALLFEKPSLRTRVSVEVAVTSLGGHAIALGPDEVGLGRRESPADVARNLSRLVDAVVLHVPLSRMLDWQSAVSGIRRLPILWLCTEASYPQEMDWGYTLDGVIFPAMTTLEMQYAVKWAVRIHIQRRRWSEEREQLLQRRAPFRADPRLRAPPPRWAAVVRVRPRLLLDVLGLARLALPLPQDRRHGVSPPVIKYAGARKPDGRAASGRRDRSS
jgi:hypothetical protein